MTKRKLSWAMTVTICLSQTILATAQMLPDYSLTIGTSANERISGIDMTPAGDVYGVGVVEGPGTPRLLIVRQYWDGTLAFAKTYDFGVYSSGRSIEVMANGDIAVSGYLETRFVDVLTMRLDSLGNVIWGKAWGSGDWDPGNGMTIDASGNIIQNVASLGLGNIDDVELRYDPNGSLTSVSGWHANVNDGSPRAPAVDAAGNSYTVGHTGDWSFPGGQDIILIKRSPSGTILWDRKWVGDETESASAVSVATDGSIYVCGASGSFGAGSWNSADMILLRFDSSGTLLWQKSWGGSGNDNAQSLWLSTDGSVYVVGKSNSFGAGGEDLVLLRYSDAGILLSQHAWGSAGNESATEVKGLSSGMFAIAGFAPQCGGQWQLINGIEGNPSGVVTDNIGVGVTPIGDVISVTPIAADLTGVECSGGGGEDALLLTLRFCVPPVMCDFDSQDVNCDGAVDIVDVVLTIGVAFRGGAASSPCCSFQ